MNFNNSLKNKKAISGVIEVTILVLLAIVGIAIIWTYVSPFIFEKLDEIKINSICAQNNFFVSNARYDEESLHFTIKRSGATDEKFYSIKVYTEKGHLMEIDDSPILYLNNAEGRFELETDIEDGEKLFLLPMVKFKDENIPCSMTSGYEIDIRD